MEPLIIGLPVSNTCLVSTAIVQMLFHNVQFPSQGLLNKKKLQEIKGNGLGTINYLVWQSHKADGPGSIPW
jgi:hypothetical protein